MSAKRTSKPAAPATIAARVVREHLLRDPSVDLFNDEMAWPGIDKLLDALEAALPPHQQKDVLSIAQACARQEAIKAALPEPLRAQFWALCEWGSLNACLCQGAGYLLGVAMGKRLARGVPCSS